MANREHELTTRGFAAGRASFMVECGSVAVRDAVEELFVDLPEVNGSNAPSRISLDEDEDGKWTIHVDDERRNSALTPSGALGSVVSAVSRLALDADPDHLHLHCAAIARGGEAILIAGRSGTGKSTLAAKLVLRRWDYLSDEAIALDPLSPLAVGFPKPLVIKPGGGDLVPELGSARVRLGDPAEPWWNVPASAIPATTITDIKPTAIVILDHGPDGFDEEQPSLIPLHPADAIVTLMGHTMDAGRFGSEAVAVLARLAARSNCARVVVGKLNAEADMLESLAADTPRVHEVSELDPPSEESPFAWQVADTVRSLMVGERAIVHDWDGGAIVALDEAGSGVWCAMNGASPSWWDDDAISAPGTLAFLEQLNAQGLVVPERTPEWTGG